MRSAKDAGSSFPYRSKLVCYFEVDAQGKTIQMQTNQTEAANVYHRVMKGKTKLYAVWPGQWRSDLFAIDDMVTFAEAFKVPVS